MQACHIQECLVCEDISVISWDDCTRRPRPHGRPRVGYQLWDDQVYGCRHEKCSVYNPNAGPPSNAYQYLRRPASSLPQPGLLVPEPAGPFAPITQAYGGYRQRSPKPRRGPEPQSKSQQRLSPQPSQTNVVPRQPQTSGGNNGSGTSPFLAPTRPAAPVSQLPLYQPSPPLRRSHSPLRDPSPARIAPSGSMSGSKTSHQGVASAFHQPPAGPKMPPTAPLPKTRGKMPGWTMEETEKLLKMQIRHLRVWETKELDGRSLASMQNRLRWLRQNPEEMQKVRDGAIFRTWSPPQPPPKQPRAPSLPSKGRSAFDNTKPNRGGDDDDGSGVANVGGFKAVRT